MHVNTTKRRENRNFLIASVKLTRIVLYLMRENINSAPSILGVVNFLLKVSRLHTHTKALAAAANFPFLL